MNRMLLPPHEAAFLSLVLVGHRDPPLWHWDTWQRCVGALDQLVRTTGADAAVRSLQVRRGERKWFPFGRLGWKPEHHERWLHGAPRAGADAAERRFRATEIWAPRWTHCEKTHRAPWLFVEIENPHSMLTTPLPGQYNTLVHVAVADVVLRKSMAEFETAIAELAQNLSSTLVVQRAAPWLHNGDCLRDGLNNHFSCRGSAQDLVLDLDRLTRQTPWIPWEGKSCL